jgi:hypothetical protein
MKIKLLESWGGADFGTSLSIDDAIGQNLIERGIANKTSARKGAAKSGGKDEIK